MFKATTADAALAPFKKVLANLAEVVAYQANRCQIAKAEMNTLREQFERAAKEKENSIETADVESARAAKMLAKLEALLLED